MSSLLGAIGGSNWFTSWIFSAIAQIITVPFSALVSVLLYLDLRSRKEALTATTLRAELAWSEGSSRPDAPRVVVLMCHEEREEVFALLAEMGARPIDIATELTTLVPRLQERPRRG